MVAEAVLTVPPGVVLSGVPLVERVGGSALRQVQPALEGRTHSPESARDRIRSILLVEDIHRFEGPILPELVG